MIELKIPFSDFETERRAKTKTMIELPDTIEADCRVRFQARYGTEFERMARVIEFGKNLKSKDPKHPSIRAYFSHPLRVARMADACLPSPDSTTIETALIHNVFEVSGVARAELFSLGLEPVVVDGIACLTIDRSREEDETYLRSYYQGIAKFSNGAALIKCLDKLDNLWTLEILEDQELKRRYLRQCRSHLLPLAKGLSDELHQYLAMTIDHVEQTGFNAKFRNEWQKFLQAYAG